MTSARILIIENEKDILDMLCINLIRDGYQVSACQSAAEAMAALSAGNFDLLITDNYLADGLGSEQLGFTGSIC